MNELVKKHFKVVRGQVFGANQECIEYAMDYQPGPNDRVLLTYPKCGTWWSAYIVLYIMSSGRLSKGTPDYDRYLLENEGHAVVNREAGDRVVDPELNFIRTHLSFRSFAYNPSAKYLMVLRNPKDCYVSHYYYFKKWANIETTFERYLKFMESGNGCPYGQYFEAVLSYWEHREDSNCTVITYEEMLANPRDSIVRIASFLGTKYVDRLYDRFNGDDGTGSCGDTLLDRLLQASTFESMKSTHKVTDEHFRKGMAGDWRSHMSRDDSDLIDQKIREHWMGTGLETVWERALKWHDCH